MGVSKSDAIALDNYSRKMSIDCYDEVIILLAKYTFMEWSEIIDPDSMTYWIITFGIIDWIRYTTPEMYNYEYTPSSKNTIGTIIKMHKKICKYSSVDYAENMILYAIIDQTKLSDILQLAGLTNNQFGFVNQYYYISVSGHFIYRHANLMDLLIIMGYISRDYHLAYEHDGELVDTTDKIAIHAREKYQLYCIERMKSY